MTPTLATINNVTQLQGLAAALDDCRRDAYEPAGTMEMIAKRHGIDPFELCVLWLDDPGFAATAAKRAERESR